MNYMEKEYKDDGSESYNIDVYLDEDEYTSVTISVTNNTSTVEINLSDEYLDAASAATIKIIYNFAVPSEDFNFKTQVFDYISKNDFYFYHKLDVLFNE